MVPFNEFDQDDFTDDERREAERQGLRGALIGAAVGLIVVAVMLLSTCEAKAHDPYAWIMDNPSTSYCCGPDDCEVVAENRVTRSNGHYLVDGYPVGDENVHLARSGRHEYWVCWMLEDDGDEPDRTKPNCLFVPFSG